MSRPRDPELDAKIIEAATEEFHTVGYGAMSLGSIAVRAGVRPGAVYTRFRDKRDVLRAILEHVSTLRAERLRTLPGDDPYENLLYATRETHTSVSWEHAFTIPALAIMGTEEADEVRDLIRDDMASNRQMGLLRPALEGGCRPRSPTGQSVCQLRGSNDPRRLLHLQARRRLRALARRHAPEAPTDSRSKGP
ncbi:MAG: hypothetical protein Ct9H300mP31_21410 [Acidimicrobiaceae bacterium]|nr:MAG: hypothetical protein Ct9H300mP31_21410 [Acidimicrobiaceae bacterium]